ncbi:cytochrome c biogenesis protein ResB [Streptomyces gobiensis]|uniref:cytochrome c biogenesis protein ResB n=1 Tax=Streptomyces gobiensis TaxID=2875706 RepID=UPI001E42C8F0|nr:cytochrome c biogenesis protein ResB [Streptomyces gobiensis]UGY92934.1 cytochrome c biogenesis protein ResB [Streptomyces gobiensis]
MSNTDVEERDAGAQLSTAPSEEPAQPAGPALGVIGWARWFWRQLTSMRIALILLLLLSLATIPGSLIPQNSVDDSKVAQFQERHETLTPVYEKLQLFDVYSSVWFSAIYILLFISLIGCIVPRSWQFVGQLRARPPRAPGRLTRMPAYTTWHTDAEPGRVLSAARKLLGRKRFRVAPKAPGDSSLAAEKGYVREAGNLVFHIALIVMLIAFAAGQLWKSEGGKLIVEGDGFSNTLTQYDDFKGGSLYDPQDLDSFGFTLDKFHSSFEPSGPQKGTPREFRADVTYWEGADGAEKKTAIEVNRPLQVGDSKVYLLEHGYAPVVTVKDGQGEVAYEGPVPFLPQDANVTSSGVVKVPDYRDKDNKKSQLGFQGFFVPTFEEDSGTMFSQFPAAINPVLFLTAYHGDLGIDAGLPQNVYQLETKKLKQFKTKDGKPVAKKLQPGETMTLPNGAGELKFEGVQRWATFQISQAPGKGWALGGALAAVLGLAASLFIQRRRVWVRTSAGPDGRTVVEMAGLGRSESAKVPEELGELAEALRAEAPVAKETPAESAEGEPQ